MKIHTRNLRHSNRTSAATIVSQNVGETHLNIKSRTKRYKLTTDTKWKLHNWAIQGCTMITIVLLVLLSRTMTAIATTNSHIAWQTPTTSSYNEPFTQGDDGFHPIIPTDISREYISRNVFTRAGQYRVFESVDSDLRATTQIENRKRKLHQNNWEKLQQEQELIAVEAVAEAFGPDTTTNDVNTQHQGVEISPIKRNFYVEDIENQKPIEAKMPIDTMATATKQFNVADDENQGDSKESRKKEPTLSAEFKSLEELLIEYVENFFTKGQYEPLPGLVIELQKNHTLTNETTAQSADDMTPSTTGVGDAVNLVRTVRQTERAAAAATDGKIRIDVPRALQTGRLLFFTGLKKILWPIWVGLQILKSLLFAMFLPSLIGSFGKLVGKGIASASIRPMDAPQDLDFRDNTFNFDEENNKFIINDDASKDGAGGGYAYNQPEASQTNYAYNLPAGVNNQVLSRYGVNEKQHIKMPDTYLSALQSISSASFKNSNSISGSFSQGGGGGGGATIAAMTPIRPKPAAANFQTFQKVPASSLLLSNYDPFYSPLLSRLDSVFAQLKLNSENEVCREKLICLMYANPAKYAPYSNLVSAQLSRELNELRKPTSDNPDILRFFKYMRAAKDGQDGIDCEISFDKCKEFKDFENPAMVSTYHDINKLVQARKLT